MALMLMMAVAVLVSTIELGYILVKDIITPPPVLLQLDQLLEIFGLFLLVLIGFELLETIKTYIEENAVRVEVVLVVAMIAIARKIIILDVKTMPSLTLIAIGFIIIALAIGYYLIKRSRIEETGTLSKGAIDNKSQSTAD
jgi:uncharacterized membrane protein (DUF373 family)